MKTSATISLVPELSNGPWIYGETLAAGIAKAKAVGFDAVELFPGSPDTIEVDQLATLLDDHECEVSAFGSGAGRVMHGLSLTDPAEAVRLGARQYIARLIDIAGLFGAPVIIGSMQGLVDKNADRDQTLDWLRGSLNELGERASAHGVKLILEPLNRYETNIVNRLSDGSALIRSLNTSNVTLLADLFHMNIEEDSLPAAIHAASGDIGYVHLADSNRRAAGMGHIDFREVISALSAIGFQGFLSAECLPYPDPDLAASQTIASCRALGIAS